MSSNNFDGPVLLDEISSYLGFGRSAGGESSTGPRLYGGGANLNAYNGQVSAPAGSLGMCGNGTTCRNTDGGTTWELMIGQSELTEQLSEISGGGTEVATIYTDEAPASLADADTNNIVIHAEADGITANVALPAVASSPKTDYRIFLIDPNFTSTITLVPSGSDTLLGATTLAEGDRTYHLIHDGVSTWVGFYSLPST